MVMKHNAMSKNLRQSIIAGAVTMIPLLVLMVSMQIFVQMLFLWVVLAPGAIAYGVVCALRPVFLRYVPGTEEYEAYVEKALAALDAQYKTTGKDASRMLANWTIMMPAVFRLTGVLSTKEAVTKVLNDQTTRFEMNRDLEKFRDTLEMAFFMNTVASRFQKSAIERSPYYVDALTLFGMMDLITETNEGQKTFWANVALEEPDIAEVLTEEEKIPTAEEEAQMEEEKLQEDLADAA